MRKYLVIVALCALASSAGAYTYPPEVTAGLRRLLVGSGVKAAVATCMVARIQQQYSLDAFVNEVTVLGGELSPAMRRLAMTCVLENE